MNELQVQFIGSPSHGISIDEARDKIRVEYAKHDDAGIDLYNCFCGMLHIAPKHSIVVPCGIAVKLPQGTVGFIVARSSTFRTHGLQVIDARIDAGYTGALYVTVYNPGIDGGEKPVLVRPWERLAQLIVLPYIQCEMSVVDQLPKTVRGQTGFGSSGR